MKKYGIGIVGCGMISEYQARAFAELPNARLAAVVSRHEENARKLTDLYNVPWHKDVEDLIARDDVDIVTICTPSGAHLEPAVAAAEAGKHVIVEKPLEVTLDRCDAIIRACEENHVQLCAVFPSRFQDVNQELKRAIDQGRFGRITVADVYNKWWRTQQYYDSGGWRGTRKLDGGGALMNQAIHAVDLLQWFMGPVDSIAAFTDLLCHERIEVEDTAVAALRFKNGAIGTIEATTSIWPGFTRRIEVHGCKGSVKLDSENVEVWQFEDERPEDAQIREKYAKKSGLSGGAADPRAISHEFHRRQFDDFIKAIDAGKEPLVHGREGRKAVEIILGIYESNRTRRFVRLPLVARKKSK
jgi:predicted dehydrogenase